jgi:hypothetical protein
MSGTKKGTGKYMGNFRDTIIVYFDGEDKEQADRLVKKWFGNSEKIVSSGVYKLDSIDAFELLENYKTMKLRYENGEPVKKPSLSARKEMLDFLDTEHNHILALKEELNREHDNLKNIIKRENPTIDNTAELDLLLFDDARFKDYMRRSSDLHEKTLDVEGSMMLLDSSIKLEETKRKNAQQGRD